jgi:hypothetical protein
MGDARNPVDRRAMLAGAGAVGALAAAATLLPGTQEAGTVAKVATAKLAPDGSAGYRLTDHVKQYYKTARI